MVVTWWIVGVFPSEMKKIILKTAEYTSSLKCLRNRENSAEEQSLRHVDI